MSRTLIAVLALAPLCCAQSQSAFRWIAEVDGSGSGQLAGLGTDAQGNIYLAGSTRSANFLVKGAVQDHLSGNSDVFVTKFDPSGNIVYSTYFGGNADEYVTAMTVGADGSVYVTGNTTSTDFPTTPGAYSPTAPPPPAGGGYLSFLFKLAPDGSVGYATYFSNSQTALNAIAVDSAGSVYLTGLSYGGLATTPGVYRTSCTCIPPVGMFSFFAINDAFLTRFDPTGSHLVFSTYLGAPLVASAIALASDGSAYVAGAPTRSGTPGVFHMDAKGTSVIASATTGLNTQAIVLARDGSLYLTGPAGTGSDPFRTTPGAFQTSSGLGPNANSSQTGIVKMNAGLGSVLASTYFGGALGTAAKVLTLDAAGNLYIGGYTSPRSLPTRAPLMQGFGLSSTGYVAELSADLSTLLFSSPFGDNETFGVNGLAIGANGNLALAGTTGLPSQNVWANSVVLAEPPALRIDAIRNQASQFSDPLSAGETIVIQGAGFDGGAQLLIGGVAVTPLSISATDIVATVPSGLSSAAATIQVLSGGGASNIVLAALAAQL
ncbi:MAG TPA: IPT/TIG domain-containing protein [Candidatus Acidoferrum sp.]|nr:IPT/TIG domain-containing protein [Candidatus Acidoferrum sp.]